MSTLTPAPESPASPPQRPLTRAALGGAITALLAVLPVSLLKTAALFYGLCVPFYLDGPVALSTCGVFYNTWKFSNTSCLGYMVFTALGGAVFGSVTGKLAIRKAQARAIPGSSTHPFHLFWWGALGGLLFALLFVFIFTYPGQ